MNIMRLITSFVMLLVVSGMSFAESPTAAQQNFITLADIHFTPFTSCSSSKSCPLIRQLVQTPASQWAGLLSAKEKTYSGYREDTNYPLLVSALDDASETASEKHARFVIVLGDTLAHDYRRLYKYYSGDKSFAGYQNFVNKTYQFINIQLSHAFPGQDIYMVVGNNDSYRGDYATRVGGAFFQNEAALWSQLIKNGNNRAVMRREFNNAGYYAVTLSSLDTKLIVLNTNLFSSKGRGKNLDKAAEAQLKWLHKQLEAARAAHQAVLIALHIPEGIDVYATLRIRGLSMVELWHDRYIDQYQAEVAEFAPEIVAVLAGHLHSDWMQLLRYSKLNEIPVIGTPSISPVFGNNPGYKLYTYVPAQKKLVDFVTYYLTLDDKQAWNEEYEFQRIYNAGCKNCPVTAGINLIKKEGYLADHYKRYYTLGTQSQPITTKWNPYYWCAIHHVDASGYKACLG